MRRGGLIDERALLGGTPVTETVLDVPASFGQARRAFAELRQIDPTPDVVVCGTDLLAMGMIVEAQARRCACLVT